MSDESLEQIEQQIASATPAGAPAALRSAVLMDVKRELRAARWDRRLSRAAAVLLAVGIGMNGAIALQSQGQSRESVAEKWPGSASFVNTAAIVAQATDAQTARQYARQLAAMIGHRLTEDESAAIDAAVQDSAGREGKG